MLSVSYTSPLAEFVHNLGHAYVKELEPALCMYTQLYTMAHYQVNIMGALLVFMINCLHAADCCNLPPTCITSAVFNIHNY